ncbi:MAG TPA: T9SS type A sorting domain-containing protein [Chitinophagaceae bacterium]|jgi:hypothetical protein|nr:T9SS type A sorting domain-containing protein [Chitinophagaceae bacterium]
MKKILLFFLTICSFAIVNTAKAQCDLGLSNVKIDAQPGQQIGTGSATDPVRCRVTFNAEFDIKTNSGFKYLFFHSWLQSNYPNVFNCDPNAPIGGHTPNISPGNVTQLGDTIFEAGASILDLGFIGLNTVTFPLNTTVDVTNKIAVTGEYPNNDNNNGQLVALNTATNATITRTATDTLHFIITGIVVEVLGPCQPLTVITDVWGTNAQGSGGQPSKSKIGAQCYICGQSTSVNDPTLALSSLCGAPRQFSFSISTAISAAYTYHYKVYFVDVLPPFDEYLVYEGDVMLSANSADVPPSSFSSGTITLDYATYSAFYASGAANYASIRLDVTVPGLYDNAISRTADQSCETLPINLKSFNAVRKNTSYVDLKWETEQEQNNKGFYVQRKLSNGAWQNIDFVESKALNGNSTSTLTYEFSDFNNAKGISQYRLRQFDIDGKNAYSLIRSVRGEGQKAKTIIYPNPSGDGKVNIVFEDADSPRDVSLMDVSGKTIKQWKGVTNNTIQVDNLNSGFYTVRIVNVETGEQVVEKFIVNKR